MGGYSFSHVSAVTRYLSLRGPDIDKLGTINMGDTVVDTVENTSHAVGVGYDMRDTQRIGYIS